MTSVLACITNSPQHLAGCNGWRRGPGGIRHETYGPCRGCAVRYRACMSHGSPRPAEAGLLCWDCWTKLRDGLGRMPDLVAHMRSIEAAGSVDANTAVAGTFGSRWPLSESHILANQVYTDLAATVIAYATDWRTEEPEWPETATADPMTGFTPDVDVRDVYTLTADLVGFLLLNLDRVVSMVGGARRSAELIQSMRQANLRFSMTEPAHKIPYMRCQKCGHAQLRWEPPINASDEVKIECERCGHAHTHDWYDEYLNAITHPTRPTPETTPKEQEQHA